MRTLGIDLSANPAKTGVARIDWTAATVEFIARPATDDQLVRAVAEADMTGIDIPLGWPDRFVEAVTAHHAGDAWPVMGIDPPGDREPLRYRETDRAVRAGGSAPLSVSTDRIGVATMRGARLQHLLRGVGVPVDRSGTTGKLAEVYPAAALRSWGLTSTGYKGRPNSLVCAHLVLELAQRCGSMASAVLACLDGCDDDGLDAVVAAIVAKAVLDGRTTGPTERELEAARREGWIHVPTEPLEQIVESDR